MIFLNSSDEEDNADKPIFKVPEVVLIEDSLLSDNDGGSQSFMGTCSQASGLSSHSGRSFDEAWWPVPSPTSGELVTDDFTEHYPDLQRVMIGNLPQAHRSRVANSLTQLARLGPVFHSDEYEGHIGVTTACSGTEIVIWTLQRCVQLLVLMLHEVRFTLGIRALWACDNGKLPVRWMKEVMQTRVIFDDIHGLKDGWCKTSHPKNHVRKVVVGEVFVAGFQCTDVSLLNPNRALHKSCIKQGVGKTGGTFGAAFQHIKGHGPCVILLENVRGLKGKNLRRCLQMLTQAGYIVVAVTDCSSNHALPARRARVWIVGVLSSPQLDSGSWAR